MTDSVCPGAGGIDDGFGGDGFFLLVSEKF